MAGSRRFPSRSMPKRHFDEEKKCGDDSRHIDDSDSFRESLEIAAGLALRLLEWRITSNRKRTLWRKRPRRKKLRRRKRSNRLLQSFTSARADTLFPGRMLSRASRSAAVAAGRCRRAPNHSGGKVQSGLTVSDVSIVRPAVMVAITLTSLMVLALTSCGSLSRTTKSANLPASMLPTRSSTPSV